MNFKIISLFLIFFLIIPQGSSSPSHHRSLFAQESTDPVQIICSTDSDCPTNSVCYTDNCICKFGYLWADKTRCVQLRCYRNIDCLGFFLYSTCGNQSAHACTCEPNAYLNPFNQECVNYIDPVVLWFGFVLILGIIILCPAGAIYRKAMILKKKNEEKSQHGYSAHPLHITHGISSIENPNYESLDSSPPPYLINNPVVPNLNRENSIQNSVNVNFNSQTNDLTIEPGSNSDCIAYTAKLNQVQFEH